MNASPVTELEVLRDPAAIAVLMDPARRRLLDALAHRPDSAVGLARRLGDTRQRLNYHLRQLEAAGLVELAEERPRRGVKERVMRPVARRFVVDPAALGALGGGGELRDGDRFSATWLVALASRAIRELADLMHRAADRGKRLPTAGMSARVRLAEPADFEPLVEELGRAVADVVARWDAGEGESRCFRVILGAYPGGGEDEETDDDPRRGGGR